jgi:hypothetical protein
LCDAIPDVRDLHFQVLMLLFPSSADLSAAFCFLEGLGLKRKNSRAAA